MRGRAAKFTVRYSDGREAILLPVPKYDFSWQAVYQFQEPKLIPSGTRIVFDMTGGQLGAKSRQPRSGVAVTLALQGEGTHS